VLLCVVIASAQAVLINGVGSFDNSTGVPSSAYDNTTAAIVVERGRTYRLRVICAAGLSYMRFGIEGVCCSNVYHPCSTYHDSLMPLLMQYIRCPCRATLSLASAWIL
jgi:Multicopper oxidase